MANRLSGKRVLVTRAKGQNEKFKQLLKKAGAIPIEFPTIQIVPANNPAPLDEAIANLASYDWLIFTSTNGVTHFWERLIITGQESKDLQKPSIAAIGPATASCLNEYYVSVDLIPTKHVAEALLAEIGEVTGQHILLPTADIARDTLTKGLQEKGASVNRVTAYHTKAVEEPGNLLTLLADIDILTFTSASTVRNFVNLLPDDKKNQAIAQSTIACIGPITAQCATDLGLPVHIVAKTYTIPGLIDAIVNY